ncbi:hypothetical protein SapgrDRAFT_1951 [Saprospira grandis DSM 2844]|uniref:Uncharacterized protein n=1 Tax=Saprospira grandis DSM 2844 TaxID=694433 RepID=J0P7Z5_9BACT|nr:hypothetical protein [Saprospira grandis]EJF53642.1 hypothetical protein SapgrDRAFT_1951 [Saprospira grandis DSM 2844]
MKKWIFRIIWSSLAVSFLLFSALVIHIYMVMGPSNMKYHNSKPIQLSRIDFEGPKNDSLFHLAEREVRKTAGVQHAFLNKSHGTLVYGYAPGEVDPKAVFAKIEQLPIRPKMYVVDKEQLANGCPVLDKRSFSYRLGALIQSFF